MIIIEIYGGIFLNNYNCTQPIIITKDNDHFNYLNKVRFIKEYIENNDEFLAKNNMIALYGKWGSGKSSVMKTLMESDNTSLKINDNQFHTLFFEAWKFESDPNLAQSLFEAICVKFPTITTISKEALLNIYSVLKGFAKSTTFSIGIPSTCDLEFSAEKLIDEVEKRGSEEKAYYTQHEKFKKNFESILPKDKKIVVFIDDLDRCESENIIKLLSAIKLFFTLSDRLIFVCGVDKSAITKALKSKYHNDEEKAEEYLEKIFSFSFSMPKVNEFDRLIIDTFGENNKVGIISKFFKAIKFDNPRHLKKVLNKYKFLVSIKKTQIEESNLIPNIILDKNDDFNCKLLNSILILWTLVIYEYEYQCFLDLKNYPQKLKNYSNYISILSYDKAGQIMSEKIQILSFFSEIDSITF